MGLVRSNRITRGPSYPLVIAAGKTYTQRVVLAKSAPILSFVDSRTFAVGAGHDFEGATTVLIEGSEGGVNDGIYCLETLLVNPEVSTLATVAKGDFQQGAIGESHALQAERVTIVHGLDAQGVDVTLMRESDGCTYHVDIQYINNHTIALTPHTPISGVFVVVIRA